jgi:hypothetical protein
VSPTSNQFSAFGEIRELGAVELVSESREASFQMQPKNGFAIIATHDFPGRFRKIVFETAVILHDFFW